MLNSCSDPSPLPCRPYNDPLPPRQRAQIASGIAQAMAHLHARKVVHRDIKPGNILLEKRVRRGRDAPRVVLADLGIACRMEDGQDYATVEDIRYSLPTLCIEGSAGSDREDAFISHQHHSRSHLISLVAPLPCGL